MNKYARRSDFQIFQCVFQCILPRYTRVFYRYLSIYCIIMSGRKKTNPQAQETAARSHNQIMRGLSQIDDDVNRCPLGFKDALCFAKYNSKWGKLKLWLTTSGHTGAPRSPAKISVGKTDLALPPQAIQLVHFCGLAGV